MLSQIVGITLLLSAGRGSIAMPLNYTKYPKHYSEEIYCSKASKEYCPLLPVGCCCTRLESQSSTNNSLNDYGGESKFEYKVKCSYIQHKPSPLPEPTIDLQLYKSRITHLKQTFFNKTKLADMKSFILLSDYHLETIQARTFSGLQELYLIYIMDVKNLYFIDNTAFSNLPSLKDLVIRETGLVLVQGFSGIDCFPTSLITIVFSENQLLSKIQKNAFIDLQQCVSEVSIRDNPSLTTIEDYAFNGSHIKDLFVKDNSALRDIAPMAFAAMHSLIGLSIDNTAVHTLPTTGLKNLRFLSAKNVPYLVRFPVHSELEELERADVTYPYHCCALKKEYGFQTYYEDEIDTREKLDCDTGEVLPRSDNSWTTAGLGDQSSIYEAPLDYYYESILDYLENDTLQFLNFGDSAELETIYLFNNSNDNSENDLAENEVGWIPPGKPTMGTGYTQRSCHRDKDGKLVLTIHTGEVRCTQDAGEFSPCENLLGRPEYVILSWCVSWLAVIGNFFVIFFLLAIFFDRTRNQQRQMAVSKFLILNLAIGDFFMGIYILALTVMDGKSNGRYYRYAVEWQKKGGCDVAGFFSIFASQLSVYTLSVISLERWYAIRYAIQLEKRMSMRCGRIVMAVGWAVSLLFALLPLVGVNSYQKTAICLPMDVENISGFIYIAVLLSADIVAFLVVVVSYMSMYTIVKTANGQDKKRRIVPEVFRLQQKRNLSEEVKTKRSKKDGCFGVMDTRTADARVAKRMAVLVFTDFACFFPISFFSLFALAGLPLLSVSTAKILIVTCYPFNACCNPFLYAILTKSFRKDVTRFIKSQKRCCFRGDERRRISSRKLEKRSQGPSRLDERRKTIQVYVDGDAENLHCDVGIPCNEQKQNDVTKSNFVMSKNGAYTSFFYSNSRTDLSSCKSQKLQANQASRQSKSMLKSNSVISLSSSEKTVFQRLLIFRAISRLTLSIFKKSNISKGSCSTRQNSIETQTGATNVTTLCAKNGHGLSEAASVAAKGEESTGSCNGHTDNSVNDVGHDQEDAVIVAECYHRVASTTLQTDPPVDKNNVTSSENPKMSLATLTTKDGSSKTSLNIVKEYVTENESDIDGKIATDYV